MVEYILILTLVGSTSQSGQAIEHIPGFASQKDCLEAGNRWLTQTRWANDNRIARAICVRRTTAGERDE